MDKMEPPPEEGEEHPEWRIMAAVKTNGSSALFDSGSVTRNLVFPPHRPALPPFSAASRVLRTVQGGSFCLERKSGGKMASQDAYKLWEEIYNWIAPGCQPELHQ